jgi:hypothetical protein
VASSRIRCARGGGSIELLSTCKTMTLGVHAVYLSRKHLPIKA